MEMMVLVKFCDLFADIEFNAKSLSIYQLYGVTCPGMLKYESLQVRVVICLVL